MGLIFDTYALIEWLRDGNENYREFFESREEKFITILVLMEFYFFIHHFIGQKKAEQLRDVLRHDFKMLSVSAETAVQTAILRSKMYRSKKKMSYADCLCYALALEHGHKVLTGDEQFRNLEHVVFVN